MKNPSFNQLLQQYKSIYQDALATGVVDPTICALGQIADLLQDGVIKLQEENKRLRTKMMNTRNQIRAINRNQYAVDQAYIRKDIAWVEKWRKLLKEKEEALQSGRKAERLDVICHLRKTISALQLMDNSMVVDVLTKVVSSIENGDHLSD